MLGQANEEQTRREWQDRVDALRVHVPEDDRGAFGREAEREEAAHAAGRAGDENRPARVIAHAPEVSAGPPLDTTWIARHASDKRAAMPEMQGRPTVAEVSLAALRRAAWARAVLRGWPSR